MDSEEIPLTHSSATQKTRARFDSLLQSVLSQEDKGKKKRRSKRKGSVEHAFDGGESSGGRSLQSKIVQSSRSGKESSKQKEKERTNDSNSAEESDEAGFMEDTSQKSTDNLTSGFLLSDEETISTHQQRPFTKKKSKSKSYDEIKKLAGWKDRDVRSPSETADEKSFMRGKVKKKTRAKDEEYELEVVGSKNKEVGRAVKLHWENEKVDAIVEQCSNISSPTSFRQSDSSASLIEHESSSVLCSPKKPVPLPRSRKASLRSVHGNHDNQPDNSSDDDDDVCEETAVKAPPAYSDIDSTLVGSYENVEKDAESSKKKGKRRISLAKKRSENLEMQELRKQSVASTSQKHKHKDSKERESGPSVQTPSVQDVNYSYDRIFAVVIHQSDFLRADYLVSHPLVKVHIVDSHTGAYVKKSNKDRSVSFYNENASVDYILPQMTHVFDFKERRSVIPHWEELLVFNEDIDYILQHEPPVIIFFEVLDFVTFSVASSQYRRLGPEGGWHKVAWAFLKPVGVNGVKNIEKKLRLQLYKPFRPARASISSSSFCSVYTWWCHGSWDRYPATLYVTAKSIKPPDDIPPALRSKVPLQREQGTSSIGIFHEEAVEEKEEREGSEESVTTSPKCQMVPSISISSKQWSRLPVQSCKVPNHLSLSLPSSSRGCFVVKFSNSGLKLACGTSGNDANAVIVYEIPSGKEFKQYIGHQGLIYDVNWSSSDTYLVSASADCTVCIWDIELKRDAPVQMLPHPSFVYCVQFHPNNTSIIVTGCFDHVLRIWRRPKGNSQYELMQELEGHSGFVNTICFDRSGILFSADSSGHVFLWVESKSDSSRSHSQWTFLRELTLRDLKGSVINKIQVHPGGRRLLVHTRDSLLRMVDLSTGSIVQWFKGALNHRIQTSACVTPCGGLVFSASEDGAIYIWNADTGDQVAMYSGLQYTRGSCGVDYHPYEHMVALCSNDGCSPIVVCTYEKGAQGEELGLQFVPQHVVQVNDDERVSSEISQDLKNINEEGASASVPSTSSINIPQSFSLPAISSRSDDACSIRTPKKHSHLSSTKVPSPLQSPTKETDNNQKRLTSIIKKMDLVLSVPQRPRRKPKHFREVVDETIAKMQSVQTNTVDEDNISVHNGRNICDRSTQNTDYVENANNTEISSYSQKEIRNGHAVLQPGDLVIAVHNYQARRYDELSIQKGNLILVDHVANKDWLMGELQSGERGLFPANYVAPAERRNKATLNKETTVKC